MDLLTAVFFVLGLIALVSGAELLVRGASRLAIIAGISPLVVGLTVVAFGTSAPELGVSVTSAYSGQAAIAVGNVVGSNICNVLLILGLSALVAPLVVAQQLIRIEVPLMIGASLLMLLLALDGRISRLDGSLLFAGVVFYTVWAIRRSRQESKLIREEYAAGLGVEPTAEGGGLLWQLALIATGLLSLGLGSRWLVDGAVALAKTFGISELVIGLTIVAVGTSLPELATSVMASLRGQRDIAVGNVIGSNLFNILAVLGMTGIIAPNGVPVTTTALQFDIPVMIAVAVACLPIFFTGHLIARWEGALFLGYYAAYICYLILSSLQNGALPLFNSAMLWFAIPLTLITLIIALARTLRRPN